MLTRHTTTNTRKPKRTKDRAGNTLVAARARHAKYLVKMGYKGTGNVKPIAKPREVVVDPYPMSDDIPVGETMKDESYKLEESKNFAVAPAYNKGAYQVISKKDLKDIGK